MLMPVSGVCVSAVYDLPSNECILLLLHALQALQNFANEKENYNFMHEKAATNRQSLHAFGFFSIITRAFVN